MQDRHGRIIDYLRISVTDRCNLRCRYCMSAEGIPDKGHDQILSLEQIFRVVQAGTRNGIHKVRITGGEPLVRKNVTKLIEDIAGLLEIEDIAITSNGILFTAMAGALKTAGLKRVNFSLDSLVDEKVRYITRGGELAEVRRAIDTALMLELHPVKVNVVVIKGFNDQEILNFAKLAYGLPLHVRFIEFMPVGDLSFYHKDKFVSADDILGQIESVYKLKPNQTVAGSGPARYYYLDGGNGSIGFINPISHHFCRQCNRIRLTADGHLRGCLYHSKEIDLKEALQSSEGDEQLDKLFQKAIRSKPDGHEMQSGWGSENHRKMMQIGG